MREHQIVITLKPEQFQLVQKLAREAGAKSMGMFVRQQLMAALGIEGQVAGSGSTAGQMELEPMVTELKRLHSELRDIVAESLVGYGGDLGINKEEEDEGVAALVEPGRNQQAEPANAGSFSNDAIKRIAERAFALAPQLAAMQEAQIEVRAQAESSIDNDENAEITNTKTEEPEENKQNLSNLTRPLPSWNMSGIAGKADSSGRDPLSELLGSDMNTEATKKAAMISPVDDSDDAFDVPLSISARHRQLAQLLAVEKNKDQYETVAPIVPPAKPDKRDFVEERIEEKTSDEKDSDEKDSSTAANEPKTSSSQDSTGFFSTQRPLGNSDEDTPFSGGPPPKRQQ